MPSAARQRWLGKRDQLNMRKVGEQAQQRNRVPSPGADATSVWWTELQINACESLRAELRRHKTRVTLDLRRWFKPPDGAAQPTGRGLAISVKHLPAIAKLIDATLAQASAAGLLSHDGATQ
jgi:Transcriptional Coactivator p15 (PC4)